MSEKDNCIFVYMILISNERKAIIRFGAGRRKNITNELNLGCAKLIELLTISNMEEFCLYQWIFFIDSYNVDDVDIRNTDNNSQLYYLLNTQNNCFKPFAFSIAKNWNKYMTKLKHYCANLIKLERRSIKARYSKKNANKEADPSSPKRKKNEKNLHF